ncbi:MAG: hypothetical protein HY043_10205 [Verrucomicrobia bacterium]|nr:hypothetical protein [Verrucomicrobiota bacterium]
MSASVAKIFCWRCVYFAIIALLARDASAARPALPAPVYPFPGSVENAGTLDSPVPFFFNAQSLFTNFVVREHAAELPAPPLPFAEPIVQHVMYDRQTKRTGQTRAVVPVFEMLPGGQAVKWKTSRLPVGVYMLRIIGTIPAAAVVLPPKQLVFELRVNDQVDGTVSSYVLRARGTDGFACLQEFGFHVLIEREVEIGLRQMPDAETSVYLHNLELHDPLAGGVKLPGKRQPTFFSLDERARARKSFQESEAGRALRAEKAPSPKLQGASRQQRDRDLWNAFPPFNSMVNDSYHPIIGEKPALALDMQAYRQNQTAWLLHRIYGGEYGAGWDQPFAAVNSKFDEVARQPVAPKSIHSIEDFRAHRPLGETRDCGWGVLAGKNTNGLPVLFFPTARLNTIALRTAADRLARDSVNRYHLGGDELYARDLAMLLCRYAFFLPTYSLRHCVDYVTCEADIPWIPTRFYLSKFFHHDLAVAYDKLFPFIDGNQELAQAVGHFIPWIKTPADVVQFLDTHLVQYLAKNVLYDRYYYDNDTADILITLAAVQANAAISAPWMNYAWTNIYYYPHGHQPLLDILSLNTQRDGSSPIGSSFYTMGGGAAVTIGRALEFYLRAGGDPKYALELNRSPGAIAGCYYPLESTVAGQWALGIGDVGGPSISYSERTAPAANAALGWQWTRDPKFAWLLVNKNGRTIQTDEEWHAIEAAAKSIADPILGKTSRVLSDWSGILESGVGQSDPRLHRAVAVRVGQGYGHQHFDTLDLRVWAHGLIMSGDLGQRSGYGKPSHLASQVHNVVQIDSDDLLGQSWVRNLANLPGVQYLQAEAIPRKPGSMRRQVALIDVDAAGGSASSPDQANSYVFDVFRVVGGKLHTYCFHGCVDDLNFDVNVVNPHPLPRSGTPEREQLERSDSEAGYLRDFRWSRPEFMGKNFDTNAAEWIADAPEGILQATWRLARGAEKRMAQGGGALTDARKFTRLHLFDTRGQRVLHGIAIDQNDGAKINPEFPHYAGRCLFVKKRQPANATEKMESAFAAIIEPYAGTPFIRERRSVAVRPNETDAARAVAVEIKTASGRTDLCFADGRPDRKRVLTGKDTELAAEFAFISTDEDGLVRAALTGGTWLKRLNWSLTVTAPILQAKVTKIDFASGQLTLDRALPAEALGGEFVEIGDRRHRTNYEIAEARNENGLTVLTLRKSLEIARTSVTNVASAKNETGAVLETRLKKVRLEPGVWIMNGDRSKSWRVSKSDPQLVLDAPATPADFLADNGRVFALEAGPGVEVTLPTRVSLTRVKLEDGFAHEVAATVPFRIHSEPSLQISADGRAWRAVADEVIPANVGGARLYLRGLR